MHQGFPFFPNGAGGARGLDGHSSSRFRWVCASGGFRSGDPPGIGEDKALVITDALGDSWRYGVRRLLPGL